VAGTDASIAAAPSKIAPGSPPARDPKFDLSRRIDGADEMRREPEIILSPTVLPANPGRLDQPPALRGMADGERARLAASVATLTKIASIGQGGREPGLPLGDVGRTLEDMVRELLRPHLKEWLDAHLPQLVERLVRDEIARLLREAQQH
jgi:cell pole-organizing protein PopZ